jgi:hypothetical protein
MATVNRAKVGDYLDGGTRVTWQRGTIAWASRLSGMIIPNSAEEVSASEIDDQGCYICPLSSFATGGAPACGCALMEQMNAPPQPF